MTKKNICRLSLLALAPLWSATAQAAPGGPVPPVAPPPAIIANVHLQRAEAVLAALRSYVPFPINPQDVLKEVIGDLSKHVSLTAPMDLVVALDPAAGENLERPLWGFAVGVAAAEEVRALAQGRGYLTDGQAGSYRMSVPLSGGGHGLFCYLTTLSGGTGRLACSSKDRDRDLLGPYLGRLVPSLAAQASDLHAELLVDAVARTYQGPWQRILQVGGMALPQRLALGQPKFDRAVTDATQALIGELSAISRELKVISADLSLQQSGAQLRLGYVLNGRESLWAQSDAELAARPATTGAPAAFFALPADATAASYRTVDTKWAQRLLQLLWPIVDGYLEYDGLAAPDRQALADLALKIPKFGGPLTTVLAEGTSDARGAGAGASKGDDVGALLAGTYYLVTADAATDQSVAWLRALLAAYNRPGVAAYLKKKWKVISQTDPLPVLRAENVSKQLGPSAVAVALTANFSGLSKVAAAKSPVGLGDGGSGTTASGAAGGKKTLTTIYLIGAPVGDRVYVAVGSDRATLLRRIAETPKLPADKTLQHRPGLDALRQPGLTLGGFGTLAGFSSLLNVALAASRRSADDSTGISAAAKSAAGGALAGGAATNSSFDAAVLLAAIPHHGEVPYTYGSAPGVAGPQNPLGLSSVYTLQIPRLVIEDVVALIMNIALGQGSRSK